MRGLWLVIFLASFVAVSGCEYSKTSPNVATSSCDSGSSNSQAKEQAQIRKMDPATGRGRYDEFMPGYKITVPDDLPEKVRSLGKGEKTPTMNNGVREQYEREHAAGWRECLWGYRYGKIDLTQPFADLDPAADPSLYSTISNRARRDGYEECRRLLLSGGNK